MADSRRIVAVIPARGGSKGIPRKNLRPLVGKPLIAYSIEVALGCRLLDRVIVSTDDTEIAAVARQFGAEVPFWRPETLARDETPTLPVLQHAVMEIEASGGTADWVMLLQPTFPFRRVYDLEAACGLMLEGEVDSVVSASEIPHHYHPLWAWRLEEDRLTPFLSGAERYHRRQDLPTLYYRNGAIYLVSRRTLLEDNSLFGKFCRPLVMPRFLAVNLDEEWDFLFAEFLLRQGLVGVG